MLAADLFRVGVQQWNIFGHRRRERVMAGVPTILFLVEAQQREIHHPKKIKAMSRDDQLAGGLQDLRAIETDFTEDLAGIEPLIGGEENQITLLDFEFGGQGRLLLVAKELDDRRLPFAVL